MCVCVLHTHHYQSPPHRPPRLLQGAQQLYYESKGRASNLGTSGAVLDEDLYEVATDELSGGGRSSSSGGRPRSVQSSGGDGAHGAPPVLPPPGTKPGDYGSFKPVGLPPPAPARAPNTKLVGDAGGAPPRPPTRSPEGTSSDSSTSRLDPNTRPREALPPPPTPGAGVAEHPSAGGSTGSASGSRPVSGISSSSADGPSSIPKLGAGSAIPSKVGFGRVCVSGGGRGEETNKPLTTTRHHQQGQLVEQQYLRAGAGHV